jgi:hypothetical protein
VNSPDDNRIERLVERCEFLSTALLRASREDPYGHEANALSAKLFEAKSTLRQARTDEVTAAIHDEHTHSWADVFVDR